MTTLYDIGDKILITLDGKVIEYSASRNGDCYVIELSDPKQKGSRVYLSGEDLRGNSRKHYTGKAKIDFMDDMGVDRDKLSHDTEEQKEIAKSRSNSYLENLALIARETNMDTVTVPLYAYCEMLDRLKAQGKVIDELLKVGYPHNFQREEPWIVNYMYAITGVIKKAVNLNNGNTES